MANDRRVGAGLGSGLRCLATGVGLVLLISGCSSSSGTGEKQPTGQPEEPLKPAVQLVTPAALGGYPKSMDRNLTGIAQQSMSELKKEVGKVTSAVGWAYGGDSDTAEAILISGAAGTVEDPTQALDRLFASLPRLMEVRLVDPGPLGGEARCGKGESTSGAGLVEVTGCMWADKNSIGLVTFWSPDPSTNERDRSGEFVTIRGQIEQPVN